MWRAISRSERPRHVADASTDWCVAAPVLARCAARAIDAFTVLFLTLGLVLLGLVGLMNTATRTWAPAPWGESFAALILYTLTWTVYEVVFTALRGQTPGKDLCNVKVVDARTGGNPGWIQTLRRTLVFSVCRGVPGLGGAAAATVLVGAPVFGRRRSLADLVGGTVVIRYRSDDVEDVPPQPDSQDLRERYGPRHPLDGIGAGGAAGSDKKPWHRRTSPATIIERPNVGSTEGGYH